MSDNEIIKAFESCQVEVYCLGEDCPYFDSEHCGGQLLDDTLALINRQKAEIERLNRDLDLVVRNAIEATKTAMQLARGKAIKEFAERLCDDRVSNDPVVIAVKCELKEMAGDSDA